MPGKVIAGCCAVSAVLMVYTFATGNFSSPIAYITYILSAYSLTVLLVRVIPKLVKAILDRLSKIPIMDKYINDIYFRMHISLYLGFAGNAVFSFVYFIMAIVQKSPLQISLAVYNFIFSVMRLILARRFRIAKSYDEKQRTLLELKSYKATGGLMLLMSLTMSGMIWFWIKDGRNALGIIMTIALAAYTFYCFIIALVNIIRFKLSDSPALVASKCVTFARTLLSVFSLQIAMFAQFTNAKESFALVMNIATGTAVSVTCIVMAVVMIIQANKRINTTT